MLKQFFGVLGSVLLLSSIIIDSPVQAGGTNCWGARLMRHKFDRTLVSSSRCDKPTFSLASGEGDRNIRSTPNGRVIGKMNEVGEYNLLESTLIATYDDGKTYWAFGEVFSESNPTQRIQGWVEVGDESAIRQNDRPGSNDVWYKF